MLGVAAALAWALLAATGVSAEGSRDEAFIGYSERSGCKDQPDCHNKAHNDGCLRDPYDMRTFCPIACAVPRCSASGTVKARHSGYATGKGTADYVSDWVARAAATRGVDDVINESTRHFRQITYAGEALRLSSLGVGTYLGNPDAATDEAVTSALVHSVVNGWNVIDTASNYRWGHAESSVGAALDALLAGAAATDFLQEGTYRFELTRDMLLISTKVGFVDEALLGELLQAQAMAQADVVSGHTLAPAYIAASLNASLQRMNLATVDLLYLHNAAEMQLKARGRKPFMAALKQAFVALEKAKADGLIRGYGLATWDCFRLPPTDPNHLNLQDVVNLAREAAGGNASGFAAVQLPVSASMPEAWREPWQALGSGGPATLMTAAEQLGVAVFTSGPLGEGDLLRRLTGRLDGVAALRAEATTAQKLLQVARSTPGKAMASALVGHKTREYVVANTALAKREPLTEEQFRAAMEAVRAVVEAPAKD